MKKHIIHTILPVLLAVVSACQKERTSAAVPEAGQGYIDIKVVPTSPVLQSKSLVDPEKDDIFLYYIDRTGTCQGFVAPSFVSDGIFSYTVPDDTYSMIFTNTRAGDFVIVSSDDDNILIFSHNGPVTEDMAIGQAWLSDLDEDGHLQVALHRPVAKITADVHILDASGNYLDIHDYVDYAVLYLSDHYSGLCYSSGYEFMYSHTGSRYIFNGPQTSGAGMTVYRVCEDVSVFPAATENTGIELVIRDQNGSLTSFSTELDYPVEANKRYSWTINIRRNDTGFGFALEEIITEEILIDLN